MTQIILTAFVLGGVVISAMLYDHRNRQYAEGKQLSIPSSKSFRYIYRLLQYSSVLFAIVSIWVDSPYWDLFSFNVASAYLGLVISAIGLLVFTWAKTSLGREYSPCFDSFVANEIVMRGPYRLIRHPIYTGNLLVLLGLVIATGSSWLILNFLILFFYYRHAAIVEECYLCQTHAVYHDYMDKTGRFLPRLGR